MRVYGDQGPARKQEYYFRKLFTPNSLPLIFRFHGWIQETTCLVWPTGVVPSQHAYSGQFAASLFLISSKAWSVLEPGGLSFFQIVDRGLDEYFQVLDLFEGDLVGFGTLILYFSGRQDLLSGLVTHVGFCQWCRVRRRWTCWCFSELWHSSAGYRVLRPVTGPWRNGDLCWGVEATSLGGPVDLSLRTLRLLGTSALAHEDL